MYIIIIIMFIIFLLFDMIIYLTDYTFFLQMFVIMNTSNVKKEYKPYIPLLLEIIMECPVMRNGQLIPYEEIVAELEADTTNNATALGVGINSSKFSCGLYSYSALLILQVTIFYIK